MTVSIGLGRVGSIFFTCSGLGWVTQNGPMDNSARASLISHAQQLTFAPRTPAPVRKQLSRTSALARVGYVGMYPGRGQCRVPAPATTGPAEATPAT